MLDRQQLARAHDAAVVIAVEVRDHQVVDLSHAGVAGRRKNAIRIARLTRVTRPRGVALPVPANPVSIEQRLPSPE